MEIMHEPERPSGADEPDLLELTAQMGDVRIGGRPVSALLAHQAAPPRPVPLLSQSQYRPPEPAVVYSVSVSPPQPPAGLGQRPGPQLSPSHYQPGSGLTAEYLPSSSPYQPSVDNRLRWAESNHRLRRECDRMVTEIQELRTATASTSELCQFQQRGVDTATYSVR
ncbi:hypothetical protein FJT64_026382 [Amphibalanus amphitrite]|uniref:Uncharacterized protein n=1 Tax=Amphibalanus amphitrite TaxID=1232801 RepID=A0A6A4WGV1_AMPAM|nr:hypothetical protein FJT64_026382 [Amphibalanus amphitrite]